ncbi:MAG: hypothetical protein KYX62_01445 [Pseudomonadota bacterium]|nr:hypothetical protein [Pseudomonadota bacterium]
MSTDAFPVLRPVDELARYSIQVNDCRINLPCDDDADCSPVYKYWFDHVGGGVISAPEYTGEISPLNGRVLLVSGNFKVDYPSWSSSLSATVWPKSDMSMIHERWLSETDVKDDILRLFRKDVESFSEYPDVYFPSVASDVQVLNIKGRLWGHVSAGDFRQRDVFFTELDRHLVMRIVFDASACWYRDGFAPADLKAHLMTFFLDYLQHIDIVETGSATDRELPPLGFYPAAREEKEIDADGKTIDKTEESPLRHDPLGW